MQKIRIFASIKPPWVISTSPFNGAICNEITRNRWLYPPSALAPMTTTYGSMNFDRTIHTVTTNEMKEGFFSRIRGKFKLPDRGKYKRQMIGYLLYEDIVSNINYSYFFKDLKMPDTFYSWFVIMELHVWMLMIRYMAEGKPGHEIRNSIVEAMWADVNKRKTKLKKANSVALRAQEKELSLQFNAAIIGYDEGIMSDDKVLAGALWRRFFQCECNNPQDLEKLVAYVRKQIHVFDRMSGEEFMARKSTKWIDFENP